MFIGHYAAALAAKKAAPKTSLGTLFIASQFIDLLWPIFLLLGIENVRIEPGNTAVTPLDFYNYPYSHSLLFVLIWAVSFGIVYFFIKKYRTGAIVLSLLVLSHWLLDLVVHKPDLPLAPGTSNLGLGLWNSLPLTLIIELGLFALGFYMYIRTTSPSDKIGSIGFYSLMVFILVIYLINLFGPPPPDVKMIAIAGNAGWLLVLWAYWADKHRKLRQY
jgi:hypothetical protein